jgi:hypothetical protein
MFLVLTSLSDVAVRVNAEKIVSYHGTPTNGAKLLFASSDPLFVKESADMVDTILRELYLTVRRRTDPQ